MGRIELVLIPLPYKQSLFLKDMDFISTQLFAMKRQFCSLIRFRKGHGGRRPLRPPLPASLLQNKNITSILFAGHTLGSNRHDSTFHERGP